MLQQDKPPVPKAKRWPSPDASLVAYVESDRGKILQVYKIKPELIREHFGTEQSVLSSGYRYRQIFEVVQNAADAILEAADAGEDGGWIIVRLTNSHLYVGNTGAPLNKDGIIALLGANSSRKRKTQIGRFGFKSLLALGGQIDLFSQSVSMRFDPIACQRAISEELKLPPDEMAPSLRMAEVISFESEALSDEHLGDLGGWATTILRAEIKAERLGAHLLQELENFPREFVLFLPVKVSMELRLGDGTSRIIHRESDDDTITLHEGDEDEEQWIVAERAVPMTDAMRKDAGTLHGRSAVEVSPIAALPVEPIAKDRCADGIIQLLCDELTIADSAAHLSDSMRNLKCNQPREQGGGIELTENRFQITEASRNRMDRKNVAIPCCGQGREAEIDQIAGKRRTIFER
jgi:hypothetical protein